MTLKHLLHEFRQSYGKTQVVWPEEGLNEEQRGLAKTALLAGGLAAGGAAAGLLLRKPAQKEQIRAAVNRVVAARRNSHTRQAAAAARKNASILAVSVEGGRLRAARGAAEAKLRAKLAKQQAKVHVAAAKPGAPAEGRFTLARLQKANELRGQRGYGALKPLTGRQRARFDGLPAEDQARGGRLEGIARDVKGALSPGERQTARSIYGAFRKEKNFSAKLREFRFVTEEGGVPLTGRVARDRYVKKLRDEDLQRRDANIGRGAAAGAVAGLATESRRFRAGKRALIGAGLGAAGVLGIRAVTEKTRDVYGERSREGKMAERIPQVAGLGLAAALVATRVNRGRLRLKKVGPEFGKSAVNLGDKRALIAFAGLQPKGYKKPGIATGLLDETDKLASYQNADSFRRAWASQGVRPVVAADYLHQQTGALPSRVLAGGLIRERSKESLARGIESDPRLRGYGEPGVAQRALRRHEIVHSIRQQRRGGPPATVAQLAGEELAAYQAQFFGKQKLPMSFLDRLKKLGLGTVQSTLRGARGLGLKKLFEARFFDEKRRLNPAIGAALSGAASGAAFGLIPAFRRGVSGKTVLKSVAGAAGVSAGIVGGGTFIGSKILGPPTRGEGAAYTKRAAIGGAIAGTGVGLAAGLLATKTRGGRRLLRGWSREWRPARWARQGGPLAAGAIGGAAGGLVGGVQGADEGQQVDSIINLRKDIRRKNLSARVRRRLIELGFVNQPKIDDTFYDQSTGELRKGHSHGRYESPVRWAYGVGAKKLLPNPDGSDAGFGQAQVIRGFYREGKGIQKWAQRGGRLARDAGDVVIGAPRRRDAAGRPMKREWEKGWFQNAVGSAAAGAALAGGAIVTTKTPFGRSRIQPVLKKVMRSAEKRGYRIFSRSLPRLHFFDDWAEMYGWDVRHPNGRSVRVFAPGSRPRVRRRAEWRETKEGQRAILTRLALAGTTAGLGAGWVVGRKTAGKSIVPGIFKKKQAAGNVIPFVKTTTA